MASKTKTATYWTDGCGHDHNIQKISDEYLLNIIAWLQRRKQGIADAAAEEGYDLSEILDDHSTDLQTMLDELCRRSDEGIVIERKDGSEEQYKQRHFND